jgi:hypothetical protein
MRLDANDVLTRIKATYQMATPEERTMGEQWYIAARYNCKRLAQKYDVPLPVVCAIVAVLSPNCPWSRNLHDADRLLYCYAQGHPITWVSAATYPRNVRKAWVIRDTGNTELVSGPKVRAFYQCMLSPNSHAVCCDIHIYSIASGINYTTQTMPNISRANYAVIAQAFRSLASKLRVAPYRVQATCWVVRRRLISGEHLQTSLPLR